MKIDNTVNQNTTQPHNNNFCSAGWRQHSIQTSASTFKQRQHQHSIFIVFFFKKNQQLINLKSSQFVVFAMLFSRRPQKAMMFMKPCKKQEAVDFQGGKF